MVALQREMLQLRSFLIGIAGKDDEGEYRPEFVREILEASEEQPQFTFQNGKEFLRQIKSS